MTKAKDCPLLCFCGVRSSFNGIFSMDEIFILPQKKKKN